MRFAIVLAVALSIVSSVRADDAGELQELRLRIERQAAELESLREALAKLEARVTQTASNPPLTTSAKNTSVTFGGLIQGWAIADSGVQNDTFRLRRAELRFSGKVAQSIGWTVMIDPAKVLAVNGGTVNQASRILQDVIFTIPVRENALALTVGQFRIPFSLEGVAPATTIPVVDRPLFAADRARSGNFADVRDIGIGARGTLARRFDYHVGLFNGLGETQNDIDRNDRKGVIGRVVARLDGGLQLGASGAHEGERDRAGAELLFTRGAFEVKSEFVTGRELSLHRRGGYLHLGYRIAPRVQIVGRVDQWDPDTSADSNAANVLERDYIAGVNLLPREGLRLQINAVRKTFRGNVSDRNLVLVNLETAW